MIFDRSVIARSAGSVTIVPMKIIGIGGTNGAGKDSVAQILSDKYGWLAVSVSNLLRDECRRRGLPVERENLRMISAEWRRQGGLGVLIDKAVEEFERQGGTHAGLAVGSLRNPGEADRVHELGGTVVWVDADPRVRYERIQLASRGRGAEDNVTYEEFLAHEQAEMRTSGDAATLDMSAVKTAADITILNENSTSDLAQTIKTTLVP